MQDLATPLRVLLLAPRPLGLRRLPSRAKVEVLYDALETQGDQVEPEWLWPATLEELARQLGGSEGRMIGALYLDAATAASEGGLGICLEGADGREVSVTAQDLGSLLRDHPVPLVMLCLAVSDPGSEGRASELFARALVDAGVPVVVSLSQRLPAENMRRAVSAFFQALLAGHPMRHAAEEARRSLGEGPGDEQAIRLHGAGEDDLPLIAVGADRRGGVSKVIRFPSPDLLPAWQRLAVEPEAGGLPPEPVLSSVEGPVLSSVEGPVLSSVEGSAQGFFGRARELVLLEGALRGDQGNGLVLVHGYGGLGKTTLVAHAARWLVRTGRFAQVVYTDYAGGGYRESALYDLGVRLVGEGFDLREGDPLAKIEARLRETPTLVIWDGLEAVLGQGEFALTTDALRDLLSLGLRLAQLGTSRLCVISENSSLPDGGYSEGALSLSLALGCLDDSDAHDLLRGLVGGSARGLAPDAECSRLVAALGGHPLALSILASLLGERPLAEILAELHDILPGLSVGEARLGNQALDLALEALLRSLDQDFASKLPALGVFAGGLMEPLVGQIAELDQDTWAACKVKLSAAGLLREEQLPRFAVPFLRFHPVLARHLWRRSSSQHRSSVEQRYCGSYLGLLGWLTQQERRSRGLVNALVRRELPNFRRAWRILLESEQLSQATGYARHCLGFLEELGLLEEHDRMSSQLQEAVVQAIPSEGPLGRAGVRLLLARGEQLLAVGRVADAGMLFQGLSQRMDQEKGLSYAGAQADYDRGIAWARLGRCLLASGRVDAALGYSTRALDLFSSQPTGPATQRELLALHRELGDAHLAAGRLDQAQEAYQQGLALAGRIGNERAMGSMEAQLATIATIRGDPERASQLLQTALEHFRASGDTAAMAMTWSQLGALAHHASDASEAERCYQRALELAKEATRPLLEGQALVQLAQLAEEAGRPHDAEERYAEAVRVYQRHDFQSPAASAEIALAELLLRQGQLRDARVHAEAACTVMEGSTPRAPVWRAYALLRRIAKAEGDDQSEARWRERARESFAGSTEAEHVFEQWRAVIQGVSRACRGEALDGETVGLLENLEAHEEWRDLVSAIWRILGGERGPEVFGDLDHVDALVTRRILTAIEAPGMADGEDQAAEGSP